MLNSLSGWVWGSPSSSSSASTSGAAASASSSSSSSSPSPSPGKPNVGTVSTPPGVDWRWKTASVLYVFDTAQETFFPHGDYRSTTACLGCVPPYQYYFAVMDANHTYFCEPLQETFSPTIYINKELTMVWTTIQNGSVVVFGIKVGDAAKETELINRLVEYRTEAQYQSPFSKLSEEDREYIRSTSLHSDVTMTDRGDEDEGEEHEEEEEEYEYERPAKGSETNSQLTVGYKHDRSFVSRGSQIGVFKHTNDNKLEHSTTINKVGTPTGKTFTPTKMMLHDQDRTMVLMSRDDPHNLYKMDLERGEVVEEWKVDEHRAIKDFLPDQKYAQMTPTQTFKGISQNSLFRIDPRVSGSKLVESDSKTYADNRYKFNGAASTGDGSTVVVSEKGDLRMYNSLSKNAKTHFPGLGDPILGVDVSEDGKWVLGTCKNYLLVVSTEMPDHSGTAFNKQLGKNKLPPKRLVLKPEHVGMMQMEVSFSPARFNTGEGDETIIVTSSGPFVITWSFRDVKAGIYDRYRIKKFPDAVVMDNFRYGHADAIVVTLPNDVRMAASRTLTPVKSRRDTVVNSPY